MIALPIKGVSSTYSVNPSKIIAVGRNYLEHIAEGDKVGIGNSFERDVPKEPILFPKTPNTLIGSDQPIVLPAFVHNCGFDRVRTHYEAELAFFIKDRCKHVSPEQAFDHILGFTCANDVSQRNIQGADKSGWFRGKSLDTFCPVGPCVVPLEAVGDPQKLQIQCRLNGETVQDGNTHDMIFDIPALMAFVSMNFTLEPGDLILTGTPAGVGEITHGDVVEVEIENVGVLRNPVMDERI
jgi:2-keto-4-pentenoate hydratase/2-oxohepta-3-ene-1,7-dioic acid hydratase in catechol pathway